MYFPSICIALGLVPFTFARYSLKDDYNPGRFLDMFSFDTFDDPTHGYANFVDQSTARTKGLLESDNRTVTLRADSKNVASGRGRDSLRLTSKAKYNFGLVVVNLAHMPGNACGVWPAFWTTGPNWPSSGEIDILEGINLQPGNAMTMHTSEGCSLVGSSCHSDTGCGAKGGAFGDGFNLNKGGTYAMEWTKDAIKVWFFSSGQEPGDILGESPDPTKWANPVSTFQGGSNCNIDSHFKDQQIVFDTTFCGDWAGREWSKDNVCSAKAPTCEEYVKNNPKAFAEAYWTINALKVYEFDSPSTSSQSTQQPIPSSTPIATPSIPQPSPSKNPSSTSLQPPTPSTVASTSAQPSSSTVVPSLVTSYVDGGPVTVLVNPGSMVTQIITGEAVTVTLPPGAPIPQQKQVLQQEPASPQTRDEVDCPEGVNATPESRGRYRKNGRVRRRHFFGG
ncbi:MAG: hypothetical protein L6R36_007895 [Xanthoria steineri]|nr:MAG: hypothetical protein L6R36_007895 [Xanthoria steineri]